MCTLSEKSLVTFVFHEKNENVEFFLQNGIRASPKVDYCIVENCNARTESDMTISKDGDSKIYWLKRPNRSQCFGGYSESVRKIPDTYKYRFFINSTMKGPFLPPSHSPDDHWTQCFIRKFNDDVAMVGSTINVVPETHVQSMMMAVDARALKVLIDKGILFSEDIIVPKRQLIDEHEIEGSQVVLKAGYNIDCMVAAFQNVDWRKPTVHRFDEGINHDLWRKNGYYGRTLHPYETVFFKSSIKEVSEDSHVRMLTYFIQGKSIPNGETGVANSPESISSFYRPSKKFPERLIWAAATTTLGLAFVIALVFVILGSLRKRN